MFKALKLIRRFSTIRDKIKQERQTRLGKGMEARTLTTKTSDQLNNIRNIGIIAHIDAGKTTTTERMLYYAGALPSPGEIDEGTTTMDFMAQERQRGITIRSAAISFNWKDHQINLIDTPGHVDFSGEVTRSLQVLDGVITIMDGVKGVETQTKKVWATATKLKIPKICYINKMDRIGSSIQQTAQSILSKLQIQPLVMQYPIGELENLKGVIDLCSMEEYIFEGQFGQNMVTRKLEKDTAKFNEMMVERNKIIDKLSLYDDELADMYLMEENIPDALLKQKIRKILLSKQHKNKITPVFLGSSFKNKGVQPLINAVIDYLPSPLDRQPVHCYRDPKQVRQISKKQKFVGYVFKMQNDLQKGPLAFTRIYSGSLTKSVDLYNSNKKSLEKINRILRVRANQYVPIQEVTAGDIVAFSGFKQTTAGETLVESLHSDFILEPLILPEPIFTAPFILQTQKNEKEFVQYLKQAVLEDNSLRFRHEVDTNQYLVSGMGELHLQILRDKMVLDNIPVKMGNLKTNFKETISSSFQDKITIKNQIKPNVFEEFQLVIELHPLRQENDKIQEKNQIFFNFEKVKGFDENWNEFISRKVNPNRRDVGKKQQKRLKKLPINPTPIQPIEEEQEEEYTYGDEDQLPPPKNQQGQPYYHINTLPFETLYEFREACRTSMMYGKNYLPTIGINLVIKDGRYKKSTFSKSLMNKATTTLTRGLIEKNSTLIEPIMSFTIEGDNDGLQLAYTDILKKRGRITEREEDFISGFIPAFGVKGWISKLRSRGLQGSFKFYQYEEVSGINPQKLIQENQ